MRIFGYCTIDLCTSLIPSETSFIWLKSRHSLSICGKPRIFTNLVYQQAFGILMGFEMAGREDFRYPFLSFSLHVI